MAPVNSSDDSRADSENDSGRFSGWKSPEISWEPSDRSATMDPEEWIYAINQGPLSGAEIVAVKKREQEHQSDEQSADSAQPDSMEDSH